MEAWRNEDTKTENYIEFSTLILKINSFISCGKAMRTDLKKGAMVFV